MTLELPEEYCIQYLDLRLSTTGHDVCRQARGKPYSLNNRRIPRLSFQEECHLMPKEYSELRAKRAAYPEDLFSVVAEALLRGIHGYDTRRGRHSEGRPVVLCFHTYILSLITLRRWHRGIKRRWCFQHR